MELVINVSYGGFSLPQGFCEMYELDEYDDIERDDVRLVEYVKEHDGVEVEYGDLEVVTLPQGCTDYYIDEYDGAETVIYVVDGKIHFA